MKNNLLKNFSTDQVNQIGLIGKIFVKANLSKLKSFLLVFLISAYSFNIKSQSFSIVGTGNGSNALTGYPAPYGNWYWGAKHQLFITAAELTAAGITPASIISSAGFNILNLNGAVPHQGFQLVVYTTTSSNPLATAFINATQVAASTPTVINGVLGWWQHSFPSFTWNGTDNLVIETCFFNNTGYTYNYSTEWQSNLTGTEIKSRYVFQDGQPAICSQPGSSSSTTTRPLVRFGWVPGVPCAGTPGTNTSVVTPTLLCSGSSALVGLASTYSVGGITYQWQTSTTSSVGPWTSVSGATMNSVTTPTLSSPVWYQAVITCTNAGTPINSTPVSVNIAATTTNSVPYFEGFEGITADNKLPNCSWMATNMPSIARTYVSSQNQNRIPRTGSKFASFYYSPGNTSYFYSNGIQLEAGVTYSASVWYTTEYYGYTNWTDFSLSYGTTQSPTGLTTIASSNGPALSPVYKPLSNTFTVPNSGLYYIAIKGSSNGSCCGYNLSWDDLLIEVPCTLNSVSVTVNTPTSTICQGTSINLTASGATTYSWNTGATTASINIAPNSNLSYMVTGTSTLSGCTGTAIQNIVVNPSPVVSIFADKVNVCKGKSATLFAYGANTYNWSTLSNSTQIVVTPTATSSYTVIGTNQFGCIGTAIQQVTVLPQPNINGAATSANMCVGETVTLQATGPVGASYEWISPSVYIQAAQVVVSPNVNTTYTLIGTDANGCTNTSNVALTVSACTGLSSVSANNGDIKLYPNPSKGEFTLELTSALEKTIEVVDFTGRLLQSQKTSNTKLNISINNYANGIYYVKVISNSNTQVIKVVKE